MSTTRIIVERWWARGLAPALGDRAGFTVAEVMAAAGVIGIALVAVLSAMSYALAGVETGRQQSTAAFLVEQRLEQVRGTTYANVVAAGFPAEAYGALPNAPGFRRTVTITDNPGGTPNAKLVEVRVFYRPVTAVGVLATEREVRVSTLLADR